MLIRRILFLQLGLLWALPTFAKTSLAEKFRQKGYVEIYDCKQDSETFDQLYKYFEELIEFLQSNPAWAHKLYQAKERFIRSKIKNLYSTDFFGFYDESNRIGRNQISFYYSIHFHEFIRLHYPELNYLPQLTRFLDLCLQIQKPSATIFQNIAEQLGLLTIFASSYQNPPILFKVIKYLPSYVASRPHYDGTVFSLFIHSTDNQSLLLAPYKTAFTIHDFTCPKRKFCPNNQQNSILLIPGTLLAEYSIGPTPHIVIQNGKTRYATIAFAMRPHYNPPLNPLSPLPNFNC